ncbi:MAG: bacillithiol biosynthesis cysteine-adding enzyme BshC [Crocinitomicaceae bacterium]|nr:bacillithiol biosynthesis cysteine-adding enzyme BshC [Crocinitomicaceae bacterium]
MNISKVSRAQAGIFSEQQIRLVYEQESAKDFIEEPYSLAAFKNQIVKKGSQFPKETREVLVDSLMRQYAEIEHSESTRRNIKSLVQPNSFTVTTGHQLSLLTGPLYFILKIIQVIKLSEVLKKNYPDNHFVPIYWMASEDHDYEEIQSLNLFRNNLTFDYNQRGPVGRFLLNEFDLFKTQVLDFFGEEKREQVSELLDKYEGKNLTSATRGLVNELFGTYGLVIIDGDDRALKTIFSGTMKQELETKFSEHAVKITNDQLSAEGYKLQVNARPINLFYLKDGLRERIVPMENGYSVDGVGNFSKDELLKELFETPERFSPNVILRPVYQEQILPNLAYVGGAGEISYWYQLKGVFDVLGVQYPLIQVRNSVMKIDKSVQGKMDGINLGILDVFKNVDVLKKAYVKEHSANDLDFTALDEQSRKLKEMLVSYTSTFNNLEQYTSVEIKRLDKQMEGIKGKLVKVSKGKHEKAMKSIDFVKDRLFPGGGLQERNVNFLSFAADGDVQNVLNELYNAIDPFEKDLIVIQDIIN